ncbi:MAG: amidohydrolase family protein [Dehalococcoidia bacterium]
MTTPNKSTAFMGPFIDEGIRVIDMDSHWTEPPDLWTSRAPAKYRDRVPKFVPGDNGAAHWAVDGVPFYFLEANAVVNANGDKIPGILSLPFEEVDRGAYEPKARLKVLDRLGISQQIIYPNVAGFGSTNFMKVQDSELRRLCAATWNDAALEVQAEGEDRLFPQAVVPFWDVEYAVEELKRVRGLGITGITMCSEPEAFGLPYLDEEHWDTFWATCQDLQVAVNFHIGGGTDAFTRTPWKSMARKHPQRRLAVGSIGLFIDNFRVIINLIYSGLLERFPTLKFVSVESGIGWIPFVLEAADYQFEETCPDDREGLTLKPSEYFRRQIFASFWFEDFGPRNVIPLVGEDNVMFETDYPHPTCLYPGAQEHIIDVLSDLEPRVRRKVLQDTAAKLYGLPPAPAIRA